MASAKPRRRLIVNADDFGISSSVNHAVIQAHRDGILTSASLMVNGEAFEEAVTLARANPRLGVGLHLVLCCGRSTLPPGTTSPLVNHHGEFPRRPVATGLRYFFASKKLRGHLDAEIAAQFAKFKATGLLLDHVNGHLHFHLHPTVFAILIKNRVKAMRLTFDPLHLDWSLGKGRWCYRLTHALVFGMLSRRAAPTLAQRKISHSQHVFGLLENGRITADYILSLLRILPPGDSELYSHPSLHEFKHELDGLISPGVKKTLEEEEIQLIRYRDL